MRNPRMPNPTLPLISDLGYEADYESTSGDESESEIQTDEDEIKTIFSALIDNDQEFLKESIAKNPKILELEDEDGNIPIIKAIELYDTYNSYENKNILKTIFKKQFDEDLTDDKIINLTNFVRALYLLKLAYGESGQSVDDIHLKKIISSVAPTQEEGQSELDKILIEISQKLSLEETPIIYIPNKKNKDEKIDLHIHLSRVEEHFSYFIFHVDKNQDENEGKLIAISYCDGNQTYKMKKGLRLNNQYINGVTTYELKNPVDFSEKMAIEIVEKNAKKKDSSSDDEIVGIGDSKIIYSIPIKEQTRGNCALKSFNTLLRFLLELTKQEQLFCFDEKTSETKGDGNSAFKKLKQKMIENATKQVVENGKKIGKDFCDKIKIFEKIEKFLERSLKKENPATRFPKSSIELIKNVFTSHALTSSTSSKKRTYSHLE